MKNTKYKVQKNNQSPLCNLEPACRKRRKRHRSQCPRACHRTELKATARSTARRKWLPQSGNEKCITFRTTW